MSDKAWLSLAGQRIEVPGGLPDGAPAWMHGLMPDAQLVALEMLESDKWPTMPAPISAFHGVGPTRTRPKWLLVIKDVNRPQDRARLMVKVSLGNVSPHAPRFYAGKKLLRVYAAWHMGQVRALQAQQAATDAARGLDLDQAAKTSVGDLVGIVGAVLADWRPYLRSGAIEPAPVILPE